MQVHEQITGQYDQVAADTVSQIDDTAPDKSEPLRYTDPEFLPPAKITDSMLLVEEWFKKLTIVGPLKATDGFNKTRSDLLKACPFHDDFRLFFGDDDTTRIGEILLQSIGLTRLTRRQLLHCG